MEHFCAGFGYGHGGYGHGFGRGYGKFLLTNIILR